MVSLETLVLVHMLVTLDTPSTLRMDITTILDEDTTHLRLSSILLLSHSQYDNPSTTLLDRWRICFSRLLCTPKIFRIDRRMERASLDRNERLP